MERNIATELEALRRANNQREKRAAVRRKRVILGLLLAVLALLGLWVSGRMDPLLSHVGLNYHDCVQNAFGATFCGDDAKKYEQSVQSVQNELGSAQYAAAAKANVRSAIPSAEAFYADHGHYTGMTALRLRREYDSGIRGVTVVSAEKDAYCIEGTVGTETVSVSGPGGSVVTGPC